MVKYIDLFAGIGGIRLGLTQALDELGIQHECVMTSEIKPSAIQVYTDNFGNDKMVGNICEIESKNIPDFDILLAGFPCQPFSSAGKQRGFEDTRGTLFFEIARILKDKQPDFFLLENVENLVIHDLSAEDKKKGKNIGNTLETILAILEDLRYNISWKVLQASEFGVAQIRRRIYIVGSKKYTVSLDNFTKKTKNFGEIQEHIDDIPETEFSKKVLQYLSNNNLDVTHLYDKSIRDKRGKENNLHSWNMNLRGETNQYQRDMMEKLLLERRNKDKAREKGVPLKDGVGLTISELQKIHSGPSFINDITSLHSMGYIKRYTIPTCNENLYDIKCGRLSFPFTKFLDPNKPCLTLVATDANHLGVIDGNKIRQLTIRECLRLNGFPEDYKMNISYNKALDLLGNTVVVPVIKEICLRIFK